VIDPASPNVVYLLQGGLRHRVLLYYPLDVPLTQVDQSRVGDLASYALPGPNRTLVGSIEDIPWGEPAPRSGWGTGESRIMSDRFAAIPCVDAGGPGATLRPVPGSSETQLPRCTSRFRQAQQVTAGQYQTDPERFAGQDLRLSGTACGVRIDRQRGGKTFTLRQGTESALPVFIPGPAAQRDQNLISGATVVIGASAPPAQENGQGPGSIDLRVFEYNAQPSGDACGSLQ
jgi:hypothetical protein